MGIAALGVLSRVAWSWRGAVTANAFSALGVLLGHDANRNGGAADMVNFYHHRGVSVIQVVSLLILLGRRGRAALARRVA
jgi:hypothetical protein